MLNDFRFKMLNVALFDLLRVMKCDESVSVDHFFVSQLFLSYFRELFIRVAYLFFLDFSPQDFFPGRNSFKEQGLFKRVTQQHGSVKGDGFGYGQDLGGCVAAPI